MSKKDTQLGNLKKSFITPLSAEEKEKELESLMDKSTGRKKEVQENQDEKHRVTLDLSKQLARKVKAEAISRDKTLKGFIVDLINKYFDEKEGK